MTKHVSDSAPAPGSIPAPTPLPVPLPATLAEQKADFTAEGSPPPGKVATTEPVTPATAVEPVPGSKPSPKPKVKSVPHRSKRAG